VNPSPHPLAALPTSKDTRSSGFFEDTLSGDNGRGCAKSLRPSYTGVYPQTLGDNAMSFEPTGLAGLARDYGAGPLRAQLSPGSLATELLSPGELQRLSAPQENWCSTTP